MKIAIASDDIYPVAVFLARYLKEKGFEVDSYGAIKTGKLESWVDSIYEAAKAVADGKYRYGIVICYTGTGASIVANKVKGVRAALCIDAKTAEGARLWNDANVLVLSGRLTSEEVAKEIIDAWFSTTKIDPSEKENIDKLKKLDESR
jgi:ribose 5-phosphate isomerase B